MNIFEEELRLQLNGRALVAPHEGVGSIPSTTTYKRFRNKMGLEVVGKPEGGGIGPLWTRRALCLPLEI